MANIFPFEFILDELHEMNPFIKRMFGTHSIYIGERIMIAARKSEKNIADNGIWIGTDFQHHESLFEDFPSISYLNNIKMKKWLLLPESTDDFEEVAMKICELIRNGDSRIGIMPHKK